MSYYEGILVTTDHRPNAAAIGAKIEGETIESRIYSPSDTAQRLDEGIRFTFSLTTDPELFYRASLTGHNDPDISELSTGDLKEEGRDFIYPSEATKTYFCEVKSTERIKERDKYGRANIKLIEGEILKERGVEKYIDREDPLVDAMVHASRMFVADEGQKEQIRKKVKFILQDNESDLKQKILDFVQR